MDSGNGRPVDRARFARVRRDRLRGLNTGVELAAEKGAHERQRHN